MRFPVNELVIFNGEPASLPGLVLFARPFEEVSLYGLSSPRTTTNTRFSRGISLLDQKVRILLVFSLHCALSRELAKLCSHGFHSRLQISQKVVTLVEEGVLSVEVRKHRI